MTRPFIAVPAIRSAKIAGLRRSGVVAAEKILEAVFRAGGDPYLLPPGGAIRDRLGCADGAVIPGGADLDPASYGEPIRHQHTEVSDPVQDAYDIAFATALLDMGLPFLAICRGMQVVNVALGGTLIQHLPDSTVAHRQSMHRVTLQPGCATAAVMGGDEFDVSSYHHQAIDRLGTGLRVVGRADDDCIEVVEHLSAPMLAVQWHPEDYADTARHEQALFDAIVADAESHRRCRHTTRVHVPDPAPSDRSLAATSMASPSPTSSE
jgi:putative glutamine amidotransferase